MMTSLFTHGGVLKLAWKADIIPDVGYARGWSLAFAWHSRARLLRSMMSDAPTISLSFPEQDIALLTLDMPDKGANILSRSVLDELGAHLDELEKREDGSRIILNKVPLAPCPDNLCHSFMHCFTRGPRSQCLAAGFVSFYYTGVHVTNPIRGIAIHNGPSTIPAIVSVIMCWENIHDYWQVLSQGPGAKVMAIGNMRNGYHDRVMQSSAVMIQHKPADELTYPLRR